MSTTTSWQRLSVRIGLADPLDATPYESVPSHLLRLLQQWVANQFDGHHGMSDDTADIVCLKLRQTVPDSDMPLDFLASLEGFALLDAVDATLAIRTDVWEIEGDVNGMLEYLLSEGGSAYKVREDGTGLERRIDPTVARAVSAAAKTAAKEASAGSASDHLGTAWRSAYGLHPDPTKAYSETIKAVECAAHAVVQPNHARATLGTMLGEINNARAKFSTVLITPPAGDPIAVVETMMRALWDGQTSRHGKQSPTQPETLEAARAAVHLAAALVQWFTSGAITRNP